MVFVFKPSENVRKKIEDYYKNLKKDKTPPYAVFQAMDADTTITLYESGKVMFQGISADVDSNIWVAMEKKLNNRNVENESKSKDKKTENTKNSNDDYIDEYEYLKNISTVGSDEVGTGDYFGPIIVTASFVSKDNINFLKELKVGDSKKITDDKIRELAPLLIEKIPHYTLSLKNTDYNNSTEYNMNKIKAILHNKALLTLIEKEDIKPEKIVIDQFVNERKYYEYIEDSPKLLKNILFLTKAEDKVLSVAAASIISRYRFLEKMDEMSKFFGKVIPLGAHNQVDIFAAELVKEHGEEILKKVTKYNFKNTEKVKELLNN